MEEKAIVTQGRKECTQEKESSQQEKNGKKREEYKVWKDRRREAILLEEEIKFKNTNACVTV